jgi:hypothetical protein
MNTTARSSPEFRERAVRMVFDHQAKYDSHGRLNTREGWLHSRVFRHRFSFLCSGMVRYAASKTFPENWEDLFGPSPYADAQRVVIRYP